jgi:hypothetical protein
MDDERLRQNARDLIGTGRLPGSPPTRVWGGPSLGSRCTLCAVGIGRDELEFELEFESSHGVWNAPPVRLHGRCLVAWESEVKAARAALPSARGAPTMPERERTPSESGGSG